MPPQLPQPSAALLGDVVGDGAEVAAVLRKFVVVERIALQFAADGRTMSAELPGDLTNGSLAFLEMIKASAIGKGELRNETIVLLACRTWK